jgi:hypothetical protein
VAAVREGGMETVSSGSRSAALGAISGDFTVNLKRSQVSVITAPKVISLPVPAVVGTATMGRSPFPILERSS